MSDTTACNTRFCLRDLPLPAKVVVTCFLLAVGLGYSAALVQLHVRDSKSGAAMPTVDDVILKFTGRTKAGGQPAVSTFVRLITAPEEGASFGGTGTMSPAFFSKCPDYTAAVRGAERPREQVRAEHAGERDALVLWASADPDARKKAYEDDHFGIDAREMPAAITAKHKSTDGTAVKVKSIIATRCARCHTEGKADKDAAGATAYPFDKYDQIEKYLKVEKPDTVGGWTKTQEPMSLEKLTQSTHAHLLSFAVLFSLTGLAFAFTSYPTGVRCLIAPLALVATVTDVAFWWLAWLSHDYGVYFAMGVIGTGAAAGLALGAQIVLSVWNMYGPKGKLVMLLLFALGAAAAGLVFKQIILPGLEAKKQPQVNTDTGSGNGSGNGGQVPVTKQTRLEKVLRFPVKDAAGNELPVLAVPFKKEPDWNMVRALFDQDSDAFATAKKEKDDATIKELLPQRHAELAALRAWAKLPDAERQKAYEAFELPADAKQATPRYVKDGKLNVKKLVEERCARCHATEEKESVKFDESYESFKRILEPAK